MSGLSARTYVVGLGVEALANRWGGVEFSFQYADLFHSGRSKKNPVDRVARIETPTNEVLFQHGESLHRLVAYGISAVVQRDGGVKGNPGNVVDVHQLDQARGGQDEVA